MNVEQHRAAQRINATARARLIADGVLTEGNDMNDIVEAATAPNAMPLALALYFDERMFAAAERTAVKLSKAQGFVPRHLLGNTEACFAVVTRSFAWRMDPFEVARKTYQTPGGGIGFEGKLVQAVIENSGRLQPGGVTFEHYGDWSKVQGRFAMREGKREDEHGNKVKYAAPAWTDEDAKAGGCGVIVRATLRGESKPREYRMDLVQCQPRNSTLWATDPKTQICYAAVRRFASIACPGVIMGIDDDPPGEVFMGEAEVINEPITRPQAMRTNVEAPAATPATSQPVSPAEQPAESPAASAPDEKLISPSALRVLTAQLADNGLMARFCEHFQVPGPERLPMARMNEAMGWIAEAKKQQA